MLEFGMERATSAAESLAAQFVRRYDTDVLQIGDVQWRLYVVMAGIGLLFLLMVTRIYAPFDQSLALIAGKC